MKKDAQPVEGYTTEELYSMWARFKDDDHAIRILADFMGGSKAEAKALIEKFEAGGKPC